MKPSEDWGLDARDRGWADPARTQLGQKVHRVVVVAPPSAVLQWKGEMQGR